MNTLDVALMRNSAIAAYGPYGFQLPHWPIQFHTNRSLVYGRRGLPRLTVLSLLSRELCTRLPLCPFPPLLDTKS